MGIRHARSVGQRDTTHFASADLSIEFPDERRIRNWFDRITSVLGARLVGGSSRTTPLIGVLCGAPMAVSIAVLAAGSNLPPIDWQFEKYPDPMHKAGIVVAASQTSEVDGGGIVTALVRCWSATGDYDVRFVLDGQPLISPDARWQFDKGTIRSGRWRVSPRGNALVVPDSSINEMIKGIRSGNDLVLMLPSDSSHRYHIPLLGSSRAIGEMQNLCKP